MGLLYLDCAAGAAGDMLLGSLLDCFQALETNNKSSQLLSIWTQRLQAMLAIESGGRFELRRVQRNGVDSLKIDFFVGHVHSDRFGAHHQHDHGDHHHHRPHHHRRLADIRQLIAEHGGPKKAKALALQIFEILAHAEAEAHSCTPEEVHFHEVGAFDSILDIVGFSIAFELLGIDRVVATPIAAGSGTVQTAHGVLDVPTPAVQAIVRQYHLPLSKTVLGGECLTPTGAAILAAIVSSWMDAGYSVEGGVQGVGAGTRDPSTVSNVVRCKYLDTASELAA